MFVKINNVLKKQFINIWFFLNDLKFYFIFFQKLEATCYTCGIFIRYSLNIQNGLTILKHIYKIKRTSSSYNDKNFFLYLI